MENTWSIERYDSAHKAEWDTFVTASRNGTFLFRRDYMDYHSDRFDDFSLMAFHKGKLAAVMPAHRKGTELYSHNGLTYGGLVYDKEMRAELMLQLFQALIDYMKQNASVTRWTYKPIPYIYTTYPSEEDLYALHRFGARLSARKISTVIPYSGAMDFSTLRKRKVKKANQEQYTLVQDDDFAAFWEVLTANLMERHHATPVHSLHEITSLHALFPENVVLYRICDKDAHTVAGCVLYITERVVHVQYIASTPEGRAGGAVDFLFYRLIHDIYKDAPYFDLGTSVEEDGRVLNEGLIFQKEGFGGRAVVYDTYVLDL